MLSILLVSRDVSLFADIFLRLGLKKIGHEFKQDSVDLQIFFREIVRGGRAIFCFRTLNRLSTLVSWAGV